MHDTDIIRVREKWSGKFKYVTPLLKGLQYTFGNLLSKHKTIEYPEQKRPVSPRWRGLHRLNRDENGQLLCVACGLCAAVCPARAIDLTPYEPENGERYPEEFVVDELRCIFCGFCQEVCPRGAITLSTVYDYVDHTREDFLFSLDKLDDPERFRFRYQRSLAQKILG
ncbi:NuoI/complex I 23 kDa subunit family protein [Desulfovermiculus halophilus]|jgi:NADH-quinone oxidoreductase chain I|uniref:NuoI/complex I 23 kDa subunit family protein n=1 Tax=Desulfovermiculus halophilus TaxID=339722 RepID=UPI00068786D2|nr:NADH-quinone oxidoreductase subunit I [Desulfovermiculus halophilus]